MSSRKFRWSTVYESSEEELVSLLDSRGLKATRVHADMGDSQINEHANTNTIIWCAEGSLLLTIDGKVTSLQPGDAAHINASATYMIEPGITGCAYYLTTDQ